MQKLCLVIALSATLAQAALAQTAATAPATPSSSAASSATSASSKLSEADRHFMRDAAHAGTAEVQASQLALTQSTDASVKEFAQQMVTDHTEANNKLKQLAAAKGVTLPTEPSAAQQKTIKSLEGQTGPKFDKKFMAEFGTKAHHEAVALFSKEAKGGQDSDVKAFAQQTLPTLEKHLQHATHVAK